MSEKKKFHYGWVICFVGFINMCFVVCIVQNCVGMFVKPVSESLGVSRSVFSLTTTFFSVAAMCMSAMVGRLYNRFGIKRVMMVASALLPVFYGLYSVAPTIPLFYVIAFLCGLTATSMTTIATSTLMSNWFSEKRGFAMAIAATGSGIGGIFMNPFIGWLITSFGWKAAYLILAVIMAAAIIPCSFFLVKERPADVGLEPYGGPFKVASSGVAEGMTMEEARHSAVLWLFLPVALVIGASCTCIMQHSVSYFTDIGYDYTFASGMASVITASLAIGKMIIGSLMDRIGGCKGATVSLLCFLVAFLLYGFVENRIALYIATGIVGFGLSFSAVAMPVLSQDLFGRRDYANIYGIVMVSSSLGGALGSPIIAAVYDMLGSYKLAWNVLAGLIVLCIVLVNTVFRLKARREEQSVTA